MRFFLFAMLLVLALGGTATAQDNGGWGQMGQRLLEGLKEGGKTVLNSAPVKRGVNATQARLVCSTSLTDGTVPAARRDICVLLDDGRMVVQAVPFEKMLQALVLASIEPMMDDRRRMQAQRLWLRWAGILGAGSLQGMTPANAAGVVTARMIAFAKTCEHGTGCLTPAMQEALAESLGFLSALKPAEAALWQRMAAALP